MVQWDFQGWVTILFIMLKLTVKLICNCYFNRLFCKGLTYCG